jgi:hypothetical protein
VTCYLPITVHVAQRHIPVSAVGQIIVDIDSNYMLERTVSNFQKVLSLLEKLEPTAQVRKLMEQARKGIESVRMDALFDEAHQPWS